MNRPDMYMSGILILDNIGIYLYNRSIERMVLIMTRKKYKKLVRRFLTDFYNSGWVKEEKPGLCIKNTMTNIDKDARCGKYTESVRGSYAEIWSKLEQTREKLEF